MVNATQISYDPVLKELWPQSDINNLVNEGAPALAMLSKRQDFFGDILNIALQHGNPQGRSATFATAQTNEQPSTQKKWQAQRKSDYVVFSLDTELIEASQNDRGSIVRALEHESRSALEQLGRSWHHAIYDDGTGVIGDVGAYTASASTFTLGTIPDVVNFEINQEVVAAATRSGAIRSGSATVTGVNRDTGVITSDSAWDSQITGFAANDFIFVQGDAQNAATNPLKILGFAAWLPTTAPTGGDSHLGVDRSVDTVRLAGTRFDGSALTYEEAMIQGSARVSRNGAQARIDTAFMNTDDFGNFITELGSKKELMETKVGDVGFEGVKVHGGGGTFNVFPDFQCPKGRSYLLKMSTWKWYGLGESPRLIQVDGNRGLRKTSADAIEFRAVYRGELICDAPGWNGVVTLPS